MLDITTQLPLGGQSRGVGDWVIRGLKVLGVDIAGKITDFVGDKVEHGAAAGRCRDRASVRVRACSIDDGTHGKPLPVLRYASAARRESPRHRRGPLEMHPLHAVRASVRGFIRLTPQTLPLVAMCNY